VVASISLIEIAGRIRAAEPAVRRDRSVQGAVPALAPQGATDAGRLTTAPNVPAAGGPDDVCGQRRSTVPEGPIRQPTRDDDSGEVRRDRRPADRAEPNPPQPTDAPMVDGDRSGRDTGFPRPSGTSGTATLPAASEADEEDHSARAPDGRNRRTDPAPPSDEQAAVSADRGGHSEPPHGYRDDAPTCGHRGGGGLLAAAPPVHASGRRRHENRQVRAHRPPILAVRFQATQQQRRPEPPRSPATRGLTADIPERPDPGRVQRRVSDTGMVMVAREAVALGPGPRREDRHHRGHRHRADSRLR
jgi:hypothetical protein